jgi:hypothetical protein
VKNATFGPGFDTHSKNQLPMKKIAWIAALLAWGATASAQFEIRPHLGANFSNVRKTADGISTEAKLGAQLGASVMIGNKLHIMPGIAYTTRSTGYSIVNNFKTTQRVNGVIIPMLVGYRLVDATTSPFLNFRINTGPTLMYHSEAKLSNGDLNQDINWKDSQWGYQVGAGIDISMFFIDFAYEVGLSKIGEPKGGAEGFKDIKNNTFIINLGARLKFAR